MASLMLSAARAKPQVRLGHALSEFEMALSDDRKAAFRAYRSQAANSQLGLEDVRRAVAEFDKSASRPLGGRFVHVLQAVQRFAAFGDVIVGGSQSIVSSSIWGCVRITLKFVTDSVSLREKVSELFLDLGRTAPRHEQLSVLYSRSKRLQADLTEYFILLVQLCQKLFQSSTLARIAAHVKLALSDPELKNLKEQLDRWALSIDREVALLIATRVEEEAKEQWRLRELWACVSENEVKRRKMKTRLAWLDRCSEYDHTAELKRIRKQGNTTYFMGDPDYKAWKDRDASSTLLCRGTLGSGKSVLMANMVDDLVLSKTGEDCSIAYFFICDDRDSMRARTILGCLARQLLEVLPHQTWNGDLSEQSTRLDIEGITRLLCRLIPDSRRLVIVVDALDQCPRQERIELFKQLKCLRQTFQVLVCGSLRVEANLQPEADFQELDPEFVFEIPLVNPEIASFIENQLQVLLQSGELAVRDPNLVDEIRGCLLDGADGMFLWVGLQLRTLCGLDKTDKAIRQGLRGIPRGLPATYDQILSEAQCSGSRLQLRILKVLTAASRSLTIDEIREALSIVPGEICWSEENLINDIHGTLSCCGSLLFVDEEGFTVHFVHPSVRQFLLGEMKDSLPFNRWHFTIQEAQAEMAGATITYVSIFETAKQVTLHSGAAPRDVTPLLVPHPEQTLNAVLQPGALRSSIVSVVSKLNRLKHKRPASAVDISYIARDIVTPGSAAEGAASRRDRVFLSYAKSSWLIHSTGISETDKKIYCLWKRLIEDPALAETLNWSNTVLPVALGNGVADEVLWAILHSHHPLLDVQLMKCKGKIKILSACLKNVSSSMHLLTLDRRMVARLLTLALLLKEHAAIIAQLLAMDPDASYGRYGCVCAAVLSNHLPAAEALLRQIEDPATIGNLEFPLVAVAVKHSNPKMVSLLIKAGADTEKRVPLLSSLYALPNNPQHIKICYALITARETPAKGWDRALELVLSRMVATRDPLHIRLAYLLLKKGASPDRCFGYIRAAALVTFQQHLSPQLFDARVYLRPPLLWVAIHKAGMAIYNACAAGYNTRNGSWLFVIANFAIGLLLRHTLAVVAVSAIPLVIAHWYAKRIGKVLRGLLYALSLLMPFTLAGNSMKMSTAVDYLLFSFMWMIAFGLSKAAPENQVILKKEIKAG